MLQKLLAPLIVFLFYAQPLFAGSTSFDTVISAGSPQIGNGQYTTTGNTFFVDSGNAARCNAADCGTYDKPFSTLNYAINRTTSLNGDIIFVASGHEETISSATELDFDSGDIRIVGLGEGRNRPTLLVDNTAAEIDVDNPHITLENFFIDITATDVVVNFFDVNAANFTISNCEILFADSTGQATNVFTLDANADRMTIDHCYIHGSTDAGANEVLTMANTAPEDLRIINTYMVGDFVNAALYGTSTPGLRITASNFHNYQNGDHCIELTGNATGYIRDSFCSTNAFATAIDPGTLETYNVLWFDDDHPTDTVGIPVLAAADIDTASNYIGTDSADNSVATTNVAANEDGSVLERLEQIQEAVNVGSGTSMASNKSIADALGTDGTTPVDAATSVLGAIGVNDGNNTMNTATVADNEDGSVFERLEHVQSDTDKIDGITLAVNPVANSLAAFVASGGTALGTELADSKSIIDALGTDGTTPIDAATSILGAIGINDANNTFNSSTVSDNADGSLHEVAKHIIADTDKIDAATLDVAPVAGSLGRFVASGGTALGTQLADSKSLVDALGTDGTTPVDAATSVLGAIGVNDANNIMGTAAVVANSDGSVFERLEAIAAAGGLGFQHPNYLAVSTGTFDTTGVWSTAAAHEVATITGAVRMTIIPEIVTTVVSVGDTGTVALGDATTTNSLIAATTMGAGLAATGELWVDASLDDTLAIESKIDALTFVIANGKDIGYTVATNALSDGSITFHIFWTPINATGAVVAGEGGAL